jgi:hypothetical protein
MFFRFAGRCAGSRYAGEIFAGGSGARVAEDLFGSSRSVWALGAIFACSHVKGVYFYILFMSLVYAELSRMTHDPSLLTFSHSHILTSHPGQSSSDDKLESLGAYDTMYPVPSLIIWVFTLLPVAENSRSFQRLLGWNAASASVAFGRGHFSPWLLRETKEKILNQVFFLWSQKTSRMKRRVRMAICCSAACVASNSRSFPIPFGWTAVAASEECGYGNFAPGLLWDGKGATSESGRHRTVGDDRLHEEVCWNGGLLSPHYWA